MPLGATDRIAPKSILRHRPIGDAASPDVIGATTTTPVAVRASRVQVSDVMDEVFEWKRSGKTTEYPNTRPSKQTKPPAITKPQPQTDSEVSSPPKTQARPQDKPATSVRVAKTSTRSMHPFARLQRSTSEFRAHPLLYLGLGMVVMLCLWMVLSTVFSWVGTTIDDVRYGRPRTFQMDAWVGHNEQSGIPSHFIAMNLRGHIEVIELAGGDPATTRIYSGPQLYGPGEDLALVTLKFVDVNGDHQPDMIVMVNGSHIVFINDQGKFRPLLPAERPKVEQALQKLFS